MLPAVHGRLCQAALQRRLPKRLRGFGQRGQRGFPAGGFAGGGVLQPGGGLLQVARIDRVEPAIIALAEVRIGKRVRGIEAECRERARNISTQRSHALAVTGPVAGQASADQQEHRVVEQRLRHAHMALQVLAQQQVGAAGKALGQQV
ncbi:hypothetical protein D9M72_482510 [compost metagenome]